MSIQSRRGQIIVVNSVSCRRALSIKVFEFEFEFEHCRRGNVVVTISLADRGVLLTVNSLQQRDVVDSEFSPTKGCC